MHRVFKLCSVSQHRTLEYHTLHIACCIWHILHDDLLVNDIFACWSALLPCTCNHACDAGLLCTKAASILPGDLANNLWWLPSAACHSDQGGDHVGPCTSSILSHGARSYIAVTHNGLQSESCKAPAKHLITITSNS